LRSESTKNENKKQLHFEGKMYGVFDSRGHYELALYGKERYSACLTERKKSMTEFTCLDELFL